MNWSLMNNGAYDYPANTRGYTGALVLEYYTPGWVLRAGTALEPTYANGPYLNFNWAKSNSETFEIQKGLYSSQAARNYQVTFILQYLQGARISNSYQ
ncbi:MAG: hypothetical protein WDM78_07390 [Puia sp.]